MALNPGPHTLTEQSLQTYMCEFRGEWNCSLPTGLVETKPLCEHTGCRIWEFNISVLCFENTQDIGMAEIKREPGDSEVEEVSRLKDGLLAETSM